MQSKSCCYLLFVIISLIFFISNYVYAGIQDDINNLGPNGGTVYIPIGVTSVTSTITINANTTLKGHGQGSILKAANTLNGPVIENSSGSDIRLEEFAIDGNIENRSTSSNFLNNKNHVGIKISNATRIHFTGLKIYNCHNGIEVVGNSNGIIIRKCDLSNNGYSQVHVWYGNGIGLYGENTSLSDVVIENCKISSNFYNGIHGRFVKNVRVYNNSIVEHGIINPTDPNDISGDDGIKFFRSDNILTMGNWIDGAKNGGIEYWGTRQNITSANMIFDVNDGKQGAANGCSIVHVASGGEQFYGSGYLMLSNIMKDSVFGPSLENNDSSQGNPNGIMANNIVADNEHQGFHLVHVQKLLIDSNLSYGHGDYIPLPGSGREISGTIFSGSYSPPLVDFRSKWITFRGNLTFDDRLSPLQMYGMVIRSTKWAVISDNAFSDSTVANTLTGSGNEGLNWDHNLNW